MANIIDVIKYESNDEMLIYKHPTVDFNYGTELIVHESQEAVLFKDGKALQSFGPGAYTLDTKSFPFLANAYSSLAGGKSFFHSEVYFINKATQLGIKWGTTSKIRLFDPKSGMHLEIGASGTFNLKVHDGRKLLIKVVGTGDGFISQQVFDTNGLSFAQSNNSFKGFILQKVKANLARLIRENNINILLIDEYLEELSEKLKESINPTLEDYGVTMPEFYINTILTPDDDPNYRRMREQYAAKYLKVEEQAIRKSEALAMQEVALVQAETEKKVKIVKAEGEAAVEVALATAHGEALRAQGADYTMETARIIGTKAAENEGGGSSSVVSDLVQAGVGLGVGVNVAKSISQTVDEGSSWTCPKCGHKGNKGNFCENCGNRRGQQ